MTWTVALALWEGAENAHVRESSRATTYNAHPPRPPRPPKLMQGLTFFEYRDRCHIIQDLVVFIKGVALDDISARAEDISKSVSY